MAETSLGLERGSWKVFEHGVEIEYALDVLSAIDRTVIDGFNRLRHGGVEVGGVLFGVRNERTISILAFRPLSCEHALGPNFVLSKSDQLGLAEVLDSSGADPLLEGLIPVGWYHSHTRSHIHLSLQDIEIFDRYFPEPWQIALVLKPVHFELTKGGFFFREEDGSIHAAFSYREFSLPSCSFGAPPRKSEREILIDRALQKPILLRNPGLAPVNYPPGASLAPPNGLRRKPVLITLLAGLTAALIWGWMAIPRTVAPRADALPRATDTRPDPISLTLEDHDGQLRIGWNRAAAPILQSSNALLEITEGDHTAMLELNADQLQSGTVLYNRASGNVAVTMKFAGSEESAVFVGAGPPDRAGRRREAADAAPKEQEHVARINELDQIVDKLSHEKAAPIKPRARNIFAPPPVVATRREPAAIALPPPPIERIASPASLSGPLIGNLPVIPAPPDLPATRLSASRSADSPKTGASIWTGRLGKNGILSIERNRPSTGSMTGTLPPGQPVRVRVYPAELTNDGLNVYSASDKYPAGHSEPPGPANGWNKTLYVRDPRLAGAVSVLEYPGQKNGWNRLVLRGEVTKLSVILIEWDSL